MIDNSKNKIDTFYCIKIILSCYSDKYNSEAKLFFHHELDLKKKKIKFVFILSRKQQQYFPSNKRAPPLFPTKKDDFLPYVTDVVWSGFYTTRGGLKRHIWQAGQILQVSRCILSKVIFNVKKI